MGSLPSPRLSEWNSATVVNLRINLGSSGRRSNDHIGDNHLVEHLPRFQGNLPVSDGHTTSAHPPLLGDSHPRARVADGSTLPVSGVPLWMTTPRAAWLPEARPAWAEGEFASRSHRSRSALVTSRGFRKSCSRQNPDFAFLHRSQFSFGEPYTVTRSPSNLGGGKNPLNASLMCSLLPARVRTPP